MVEGDSNWPQDLAFDNIGFQLADINMEEKQLAFTELGSWLDLN